MHNKITSSEDILNSLIGDRCRINNTIKECLDGKICKVKCNLYQEIKKDFSYLLVAKPKKKEEIIEKCRVQNCDRPVAVRAEKLCHACYMRATRGHNGPGYKLMNYQGKIKGNVYLLEKYKIISQVELELMAERGEIKKNMVLVRGVRVYPKVKIDVTLTEQGPEEKDGGNG